MRWRLSRSANRSPRPCGVVALEKRNDFLRVQRIRWLERHPIGTRCVSMRMRWWPMPLQPSCDDRRSSAGGGRGGWRYYHEPSDDGGYGARVPIGGTEPVLKLTWDESSRWSDGVWSLHLTWSAHASSRVTIGGRLTTSPSHRTALQKPYGSTWRRRSRRSGFAARGIGQEDHNLHYHSARDAEIALAYCLSHSSVAGAGVHGSITVHHKPVVQAVPNRDMRLRRSEMRPR